MKKQYHKDDLRSALLTHASMSIDAHGSSHVRLRKIAMELSVSPMALYHYFPSKDALLAELAEEYRRDLTQKVMRTIENLESPKEKLMAFGRTYVTYALVHPQRFHLMFDPTYTLSPTELEKQDTALFGRFSELVIAHFGLTDQRTFSHAIFSLWSAVHGFALLTIAGPLRSMQEDPEKFKAHLEYHLSHSIR